MEEKKDICITYINSKTQDPKLQKVEGVEESLDRDDNRMMTAKSKQ